MKYFLFVLFTLILFSCGIYSYPTKSFYEINTLKVERIKNTVKSHSPLIDYEITIRLEDKFRKHPDLKLTAKEGDYQLSGAITDYSITPFSIGANEEAILNRVTLQLNLKLFNRLENNKTTYKKIEVFADYPAKKNFGLVKDSINTILAEKASEEAYAEFFLRW